jgi:hypothetical protein
MGRAERRANDPEILKRREQHTQGSVLGFPAGDVTAPTGAIGAGGWGVPNIKSTPATGTMPNVNPFVIPKSSGLTNTSQAFPNNYYVDWNLTTWRYACDQAVKFGYPVSYAALVSWVFESSPFVQSLFNAITSAVGKVPIIYVDEKGNELPEWTLELCSKSWQKELIKEIVLSHFWGFTGINIDPVNGKIYKYPMQNLDPINRMLRQSTYSFYDGEQFEDVANLLWIQPSTSYEKFLGWMQPIARSFIQMNINKNSWVQAARRLAFPLLTVGYPQDDNGYDAAGNSYNPYKLQAEAIAATIDPSKGLVYPYTLDTSGKIVKSLEIQFEGTGTPAKAHDIFNDFNEAEKNEIREMILGGTLTSSTAKSGSRALGDVHADKFESVISDLIEYVEAYLNDEYLRKITKFYKEFPAGKFVANKAKQLSIDEITQLSTVLVQNGKRLTDSFFEANGLVKEFFEDAAPTAPEAEVKAHSGFVVKKKA